MKKYNALDIELIRFGSMDIVTASGENETPDMDDPEE